MTIDENMVYAVKILPDFGRDTKDETVFLAKPIPYNHGAFYKWDVLGKSWGFSERIFPQKSIEIMAVGHIKDFLRAVGAAHVQPV